MVAARPIRLAVLVVCLAIASTACGLSGKKGCSGSQEEIMPRSSSPKQLRVANGQLFFKAKDQDGDTKVWVYEGRDRPSVVETPEGWRHSGLDFTDVAAFADRYHFQMWRSNPYASGKIWSTDGAEPELAIVDWPSVYRAPSNLTPSSDYLFFTTDIFTVGAWIFRVDATGEYTRLAEWPAGHLPWRREFGTFGDLLMVSIPATGAINSPNPALWELDPEGELTLIENLFAHEYLETDDGLWFATETHQKTGLWYYDGVDPPVREYIGVIEALAEYRDELYFTRKDFVEFDPELGRHLTWTQVLYRMDDDGVVTRVVDPRDTRDRQYPLGVLDGDLYFVNGDEIWRTDGVSQPVAITKWNPGRTWHFDEEGYVINSLQAAVYFDELYYQGWSQAGGSELYRFDGARTRIVADLYPGNDCISTDPDDYY